MNQNDDMLELVSKNRSSVDLAAAALTVLEDMDDRDELTDEHGIIHSDLETLMIEVNKVSPNTWIQSELKKSLENAKKLRNQYLNTIRVAKKLEK